jgi:DNA repair exonuclease SbcCD ATPase subunit
VKSEELDDAKSQLEQVQSQLIEESDANEEAIENLNNTLDTLKQENKELLANVDLAQNESANLSGQIETLNQRIIELEAAKKMAECQAEDLMKLSAPDSTNLEDEIIAITADRNEIKSHFDDLTEEYEQTRQTLERVQVRVAKVFVSHTIEYLHVMFRCGTIDGEWQPSGKKSSVGTR